MDESGVPIVGLLIVFLFTAGLYVWVSLAHAALFRKLGEEGWKGWVPIYNTFVLFQLGGVNMLWAIALYLPLVSIVGFVFFVIAAHGINKRFGKGVGFTILAVLAQPIWASILGWSSARPVAGDPSVGSAQWLGTSATPVAAAGSSAAEPAAWPAPAASAGGVGLSAGVAAVAPVPSEVPGRMPVSGSGAFIDNPAADASPSAAPVSPPIAESPAAAPSAFSYTPAVIAPPAWSAPAAPIEMPEEISVRVSPVHTPVVRQAVPLIDAVPGFGTPPTTPAPPGTPFVAAAAAAQPVVSAVVQHAASGHSEAAAAADDFDDDMDETIIAGRRNKAWVFETDAGQRVPLTAAVVLLGRNPSSVAEYPNAQLVTVRDAGRTISKTHARIELVDDEWTITDLHSTNGVYLVDADGDEIELESGMAANIGSRFVLGEVAARIFQEE